MMRAYRDLNLFNPFRDDLASFEMSRIGAGRRVLLVAFDGGAPLAVRDTERALGGLGYSSYGPEMGNAMVEPNYPPGRMPPVQPPGESYFARPVQGEIVRDEAGRHYELMGDQVRLLGNLVRGSDGGVFELATAPAAFGAKPQDYVDAELDRKSTRLNSSHSRASRMPSSA